MCRCESEARTAVTVAELIWELTHVVPDLLELLEVFRPLCNAVSWLLFLQSAQNCLILNGDFHELLFTLYPIQTSLLDPDGVVEVGPRILHDVGHLLQQYPVLPLNLCVAPCKTQINPR